MGSRPRTMALKTSTRSISISAFVWGVVELGTSFSSLRHEIFPIDQAQDDEHGGRAEDAGERPKRPAIAVVRRGLVKVLRCDGGVRRSPAPGVSANSGAGVSSGGASTACAVRSVRAISRPSSRTTASAYASPARISSRTFCSSMRRAFFLQGPARARADEQRGVQGVGKGDAVRRICGEIQRRAGPAPSRLHGNSLPPGHPAPGRAGHTSPPHWLAPHRRRARAARPPARGSRY